MHESNIRAAYLEWLNDWITIQCWASHYGYTIPQATRLLTIGRELHETHCQRIKELG